MSEFRTDPIFGTFSIVARERATRPQRKKLRDDSEPAGPCPFCPGNESLCPPELARVATVPGVPSAPGGWQVRAFPNHYPSVSLEAVPALTSLADRPRDYTTAPGFGVHEVVVESPHHTVPFWSQAPEQGVALFELLQGRIRELQKDQRLLAFQIFKNHRALSGESIEHPHFQLMGLPFLPLPLERILASPSCLICSHLAHEHQVDTQGKDSRLLAETSRFAAYADFAPRSPYQFSIYPKTHSPGFENASRTELEDLSQLSALLVGKLERMLGDIGLNWVVYSQPNPHGFSRPAGTAWDISMHWFIRIFPRIGRTGGFELATAIPVVQVAPEDAARAFKEKGL